MTFDVGSSYPDAIGRKWHVTCKVTLKNHTVLNVIQRRFGIIKIYGIAVVDDDLRATVLFDNGFTTIYGDEE